MPIPPKVIMNETQQPLCPVLLDDLEIIQQISVCREHDMRVTNLRETQTEGAIPCPKPD